MRMIGSSYPVSQDDVNGARFERAFVSGGTTKKTLDCLEKVSQLMLKHLYRLSSNRVSLGQHFGNRFSCTENYNRLVDVYNKFGFPLLTLIKLFIDARLLSGLLLSTSNCLRTRRV